VRPKRLFREQLSKDLSMRPAAMLQYGVVSVAVSAVDKNIYESRPEIIRQQFSK
jgi:hypothetical protein